MIVVADNSPLHYLILIEQTEILRRLYERSDSIAERTGAELLLIDESAGRAEARRRSLRVTGTLGVLRAGAEAGLLDVRDVVSRLQTTNFYVDDALLRTVFGRWLEE